MKLGDNMTMEACNVWGDVTPRKYRPPRIGEIPRRGAVDHPSPSDFPPSETKQSTTDASGSSKVPSSPEYIQEVRKDSALYLEEGEGTLKTLKSTDTDVLRRQSSGYVSRRGSFEDNRRSSTTSGDTQELRETRKPKSRALIKNLTGRVEESIDENEPILSTLEERMPTTEIHRKVSSSGLDMPNIGEVKEVIRKKPLSRQESMESPESQVLMAGVAKLQLTASVKPRKDFPRESGRSTSEMDEVVRVQQVVDTVIGSSGSSDSSAKSAKDTSVGTVTAASSSRIVDTRKLSLPGETRPSQRLPGRATNAIIRPISPRNPYISPQGSPRQRFIGPTTYGSVDSQPDSQQLNQYKVLDEIGKGSFGVVKKVYNEDDGMHYAMKIVSKRKLMKKTGIFGRIPPRRAGADPLAKVYREIAVLKKLDHPNVVKLVEVLDHPDKDNLYLVFELVHRGEILSIPTDRPLDEDVARRYFRNVVMGVEYLHYQKIVHRDIKPSNLLVDRDDRIKIADLGVSTELREPGELLTGQAGTPAFAAPETTVANAQYLGPPCDVWSMGVTLYTLVIGDLPWRAPDSTAIQEIVRNEPLTFPSRCVGNVDNVQFISPELRNLIGRMLEKSPEKRIGIPEIKQHPWLTNYATEPLPTEADNCRVPVTVTEEEVIRLGTLLLVKNMLKQHSFQNPFLSKRLGRTADNDAEIAGAESPAIGPKSGVSSTPQHDAMRDAKAERFHEAGRSNSAPDSYDWHTSGRQMSVENPLSPVTETERR